MLVSTAWVAEHLSDPQVRLVECNQDPLLYLTGHIAGAVMLDWIDDLADPVRRELIQAQQFAQMCENRGIETTTTVVLYGEPFNLWAAYAFWVFKYFGHADVRLMNGGRVRWLAEGRPLTRERPHHRPCHYRTPERLDTSIRAGREQVLACVGQPGSVLLDVRQPAEYYGQVTPPPEYPQPLRFGHIPTAVNIPWNTLVHPDGVFKQRGELETIFRHHGLTPDQTIVSYCLAGVLSSFTWYALTYLLRYPHVCCYDGGWIEWGNLVGVPIEKP